MRELGKEIKKLHGGGGGNLLDKTILGTWIKGFKRGIEKSHTFRAAIRKVRGVLKKASRSGRKAGKAVMGLFDGFDKGKGKLNAFQKVMKSFMDYFDPKYWSAKFDKINLVIEKAVKVLADPKAWTEKSADLKKIP